MRADIRKAIMEFSTRRPHVAVFASDRSLDEQLADARAEQKRIEDEMDTFEFSPHADLAEVVTHYKAARFLAMIERTIGRNLKMFEEERKRRKLVDVPVGWHDKLENLVAGLFAEADERGFGSAIRDMQRECADAPERFSDASDARLKEYYELLDQRANAATRVSDLESAAEFFPANAG
jgi:hypothetical protein